MKKVLNFLLVAIVAIAPAVGVAIAFLAKATPECVFAVDILKGCFLR